MVQEGTYAALMSSAWQTLFECVQSHTDRRCRTIAARTLAITARSAYAQIRPSPLLYSQCDPMIHRLEDEVGSDVAVRLCAAALEDADDGVAAAAIAAIV